MNDFKAWAERHNFKSPEIEKLTGFSQSYVSLLLRGKRRVGPEKAVELERKGILRARDVRPDLFAVSSIVAPIQSEEAVRPPMAGLSSDQAEGGR